MTLEEMLADASIADELEIAFGDKGKFKVADLRAADKARKTKEQKLAADIAAAQAKQDELTRLATEAAKLVEDLKAQPDPNKGKKAGGDDDIDFDTDPLYSPLMKKILKPLQDKNTELENALKTLNTTIAESGKFLLHDYYDRRWRDIPADRRPKDKGWKDYLKTAAEKKILNEFNLPDPVEAFNREQEPLNLSAKESEIAKLQKEIEDLKKAAASPRMPRPGTAGAPGGASGGGDKGAKTYTSVDDMINDAFNDPNIQEISGRA